MRERRIMTEIEYIKAKERAGMALDKYERLTLLYGGEND